MGPSTDKIMNSKRLALRAMRVMTALLATKVIALWRCMAGMRRVGLAAAATWRNQSKGAALHCWVAQIVVSKMVHCVPRRPPSALRVPAP